MESEKRVSNIWKEFAEWLVDYDVSFNAEVNGFIERMIKVLIMYFNILK